MASMKTKKQEPLDAILDLGKVIREKREKQGISQGNLSLSAGLQYTYIGAIERGKYNPTYITLRKIAKALKMDICELLEGVDMSIEED